MMRASILTMVSIVCLSVGCRDDGSADGHGGQVGVSGSGSGSGAAAGAGSAQTSVPCGSMKCEVPPQAMGVVKPCCADSATSTCGFSSSFTQSKCVAQGAPDSQCPSVMIVGAMASGCCSAKGKCGIDGSVIGMGCVELGAAAGMASGGIAIPPPKDCTPDGAGNPTSLDGGADAG